MNEQLDILCRKLDRLAEQLRELDAKFDAAMNDVGSSRGIRTRLALVEDFARRAGRVAWVVISAAVVAVVSAIINLVSLGGGR